MRKTIIRGLLVLAILCMPVMTYASTNMEDTSETTTMQQNVVRRAIERIWKYRTYNGKKQKRLWNQEEHKWLTDWITIG